MGDCVLTCATCAFAALPERASVSALPARDPDSVPTRYVKVNYGGSGCFVRKGTIAFLRGTVGVVDFLGLPPWVGGLVGGRG